MNREDMLRIISEQPKWYQKIRLPFNVETPGRDRARAATLIFPENLGGASVLDIGSAEGFFCIEAKRQGAGRVLGIDLDRDRQMTASKIAGVLNFDIEYRHKNVMDAPSLGDFDYVLCLNILHHVTDPIDAISKLIGMTRKKLTLEIADITMGISDIGRRRKSSAILGWWGWFFKLLPPNVRPAILAVDSRGRFLITRKWIRNLIESQRADIEKIAFEQSDLKHRYLVLITMRQIKRLALISGPTHIGKSEFTRGLKSADARFTGIVGINPQDAGWQAMTAARLIGGVNTGLQNLLLEYDICRPILHRYGDFEFDPSLTIKRVSEAKTAYVLVCSPGALAARVRKVLGDNPDKASKLRKKSERLIFEYSEPGRLRKLYSDWVAYCKSSGFELKFIDVTLREPKAVSEAEAMLIVS
ncbi:MAG: class I SAM-dependent methyltransferase [Deltaproteobacteria bacterium]